MSRSSVAVLRAPSVLSGTLHGPKWPLSITDWTEIGNIAFRVGPLRHETWHHGRKCDCLMHLSLSYTVTWWNASVPQHPKIGIDVLWTFLNSVFTSYHCNEHFSKTERRSTAASYCPQTRRWPLLWMCAKFHDEWGVNDELLLPILTALAHCPHWIPTTWDTWCFQSVCRCGTVAPRSGSTVVPLIGCSPLRTAPDTPTSHSLPSDCPTLPAYNNLS